MARVRQNNRTSLNPTRSSASENTDMKTTKSSYLNSLHEYVVSLLPPTVSEDSACSLDPVLTPTESNLSCAGESRSILSKSFTHRSLTDHQKPPINKDLYGHMKHKTFSTETTVCNMVCDQRPYKTSATQATASMNKCLQVYSKGNRPSIKKAISSISDSKNLTNKLTNPEVRFINVYKTLCGKLNNCANKKCPKRSSHKSQKGTYTSDEGRDCIQSKPTNVQSTVTTTKPVMIEEEACVPSNCEEKRKEKTAALNARVCCVGPCSPRPPSGAGVTVHGAAQNPVKVSTCGNSRRGVFEIVVRRLTGAPLAKNELMLEWTPPSMAPPCSLPCCTRCLPYPCSPCPPATSCKPARVSRLVICPIPHIPKCTSCCQRSCVRPCRKTACCKPKPKCCGPVPRCGTCCKSKCPPCGPCGAPCGNPCGSAPCFRSCKVGRRRPRRCRSQPRIRPHPKRESPCHNRAPSCPAVRCCRPCVSCCALPYPPRPSCSSRSVRSKSDKSGCSSCCP